MTAPNTDNLIGRTAVDRNGDKIGKIGQVYFDDRTQQPVWITVSTGFFGSSESFAPLYGATHTGDDLQLGVDKDQVRSAPNIDDDGQLSEAETSALYDHYASYLQGGAPAGAGAAGPTSDTVTDRGGDTDVQEQTSGSDTVGRHSDAELTLSEERLHVDTENVETGRARLRKYVVTENVSTTVPVSHEEVRIEREPITGADAVDGADLSEEEHEVALHAERVVTAKETVPVERVRLATETVTEQRRVDDQVRHEELDTDGVTTDAGVGGTDRTDADADTDRTDR